MRGSRELALARARKAKKKRGSVEWGYRVLHIACSRPMIFPARRLVVLLQEREKLLGSTIFIGRMIVPKGFVSKGGLEIASVGWVSIGRRAVGKILRSFAYAGSLNFHEYGRARKFLEY